MSVVVAQSRAFVLLPSLITGNSAQAITLPAGGLVSFPGGASVPASPAASPFIQFPAPWTAVTSNPGVRLIIHNFSVSTPIQPTLLNADGSTFATFSIVEPGGGHTSLGIVNETAPGVPTSALKLALQNLVQGDAAGFVVEVMAWAV